MFWVILIAITILLLWLYLRFFRMPKLNTINFVDGTNGSGKTQLCVYWAIRDAKREKRYYKIRKFLSKIFKKEIDKQPYLYSNLALKDTPFVAVNKDLMTREKVRCSLNSIGLFDEYSLMADQNLCGKGNEEVCEKMRDFWKLCRHEGFRHIFVNSQNISSVNYTLKDCISNYIYIHHRKRLPFFSIIYYREMTYSRDDTNIMNVFNNNQNNDEFMKCLVPNSVFKKYDSRAYSIFTDNLPVLDNEIIIENRKDLKQDKLVSFMKLNYLYNNIKKENEKKEGKKENG